jgi:transcriptional regulator with XRE-family HTH domain
MRNDTTKLTKNLGKRISAYRAKKGLSQEEFAAQLGITRGYLSDLERGAREMSLETLTGFCKATRSTPNQLLGY